MTIVSSVYQSSGTKNLAGPTRGVLRRNSIRSVSHEEI
jgi:hypothetical protein